MSALRFLLPAAVAGLLPRATAVPTECGSSCDEVVRPASHGLSAGATAGIVVGVVLVAVAACSALVWAYYRRRASPDTASVCTSRSASFEALPSDGEFYDTLDSQATRVARGDGKEMYFRLASYASNGSDGLLRPNTEKELPVIPARNPTSLERAILALCDEHPADLRAALLRAYDADPKLKHTQIEAQIRRLVEAPPSPEVPRSPSPAATTEKSDCGTKEELQDPEEENRRLVEDIKRVFQASQRHSSVNIPTAPAAPTPASPTSTTGPATVAKSPSKSATSPRKQPKLHRGPRI